MKSSAKTVEEYLGSLPDDRRDAVDEVRQVILSNLLAGFEESMNWGMIAYQVPLEVVADTYNGQPLMYAALASQKQHMAVYLTAIYADEGDADAFKADYIATGKKLDMGKSCVRFERVEDLPLELIGTTIAATSMAEFIDLVDRSR